MNASNGWSADKSGGLLKQQQNYVNIKKKMAL